MFTQVLVILDRQEVMAKATNEPIAGEWRELLERTWRQNNINLEAISYCLVSDTEIIKNHEANILVPIGEHCLERICSKKGIMKWQASVIKADAQFNFKKCIPMIHPQIIAKTYSWQAYNLLSGYKIKQEMSSSILYIPERIYHIKPSYKEVMQFLKEALHMPKLGIDIETGSGQINTFGVAINKLEAMAIRIEHNHWPAHEHHMIWLSIAKLMEAQVPKYYQNFIYETLYLSRYGIRSNGVAFDTMWAMKFLNPELDKGLDNVGRYYTPFPYWKDDRDDWTNIRDWDSHLTYNCNDTIGTLWAASEMEEELSERNLAILFNTYIIKLAPLVTEMCSNGLLVDEGRLSAAKKESQAKLDNLNHSLEQTFLERVGRPVNVRSPKQLKAALTEMGIKLPTKTNKDTGESGETADKKALVKLARKYPEETVITRLIDISKENKNFGSYLSFDYNQETKIANYTLDGASTETLRMASYTDPWGRGFNVQTIPKKIRTLFRAREGNMLAEIDLASAESYYVAYDSPEPKLMDLLHSGGDIHKYVAGKIYNKSEDKVTKMERQLGKKSGHAANYGVGPRTFAESCLVEMGMVISEFEAKRIIAGYFSAFPGIKKRQLRIQNEIRRFKKIILPWGHERHFYERISDSCFREAYAYAPQATIPYIMNNLILFLYKTFPEIEFSAQIHDACLFQAPKDSMEKIFAAASKPELWHPEIILPGGKLIIPITMEVGTHWQPMVKL